MKLSIHFIFSFLLASLLTSQTMAEDLPKGNETGNRLAPAEALTKMINEEEVYKIDKEQEQCPPFIQLKKMESKYIPAEKKIEKDDIFFELDGYKEQEDNKITFDNFTHENSHFQFKPKLKGKSRNLSDGCSIIAGIACRSDYQITTKDSVEFKGKARVFSIVMIGSMDSLVQINSEKNTITYTLKGNGIEDVVCSYKAAPAELKAKISSYNAQRAAEKLAFEEAWSQKINNTNRSAVKEVDQRSPAGDSSASKTQSK